MVSQYETTIQAVHSAARTHTQKSKGTVGPAVDYRPQGEALPFFSVQRLIGFPPGRSTCFQACCK